MDAERVRAIVRKLEHVEETVQWGETLVFWVGDKAIGGKMFAAVKLEPAGDRVMSFSAGRERYAELIEKEGVIPAPYMARLNWVALEHWDALDPRELATLLAGAHALTYAGLPKRTKDALALPAADRRKLVDERRKALATAKAVLPGKAATRANRSPAKPARAPGRRSPLRGKQAPSKGL